jgi:hypothetical protein
MLLFSFNPFSSTQPNKKLYGHIHLTKQKNWTTISLKIWMAISYPVLTTK